MGATGVVNRKTRKGAGEADEAAMNPRSCIVTREPLEPEKLIRFVASPDGVIVPDIRHNLPGRGCWVTAARSKVEQAVQKRLFNRALKGEFEIPLTLASDTDMLLERAALGALGMARKAGLVVTGFSKVDHAIRNGSAELVFHAVDAAEDGIRKLRQAATATRELGGPEIAATRIFTSSQMDLALGGHNVIHAAALDGGATGKLVELTRFLVRYRES
ncbi:MAG: RNA-binding protein [Nitratireductor sp.]|nr:RNA-binding protein [Nitratireductor sp.]